MTSDWPLQIEPVGSLGAKIEQHESIGSTNDRAAVMAGEGAPHGSLVLADTQSAGRGRQGRAWATPSGSAIAMSIVLKDTLSHPTLITAASGLAAAEAIAEVTGLNTRIKWPNDIVVETPGGLRKLGGILEEGRIGHGVLKYVVLGIGINVNIEEAALPAELQNIATSIQIATGRPWERSVIANAILRHLDQELGALDKARGLLERYKSLCVSVGRRVRVHLPTGGHIDGTASGITDNGALVLTRDDGRTEIIRAGDVTLK